MDNRRGPGSSDPSRYVPELGTDTVPVKLVELQSVGTRRQRGTLPFFLVGIAVVAVVAFALGGSLSKAPVASANPTSAAVLPSISGDSAPDRDCAHLVTHTDAGADVSMDLDAKRAECRHVHRGRVGCGRSGAPPREAQRG